MKLLQTKIKSILFILLFIIFNKGSYSQEFYLGVDLSYVNELQDSGVKYFSADAVETDPFELLANKGANLVRLRLWHNPEWTNYSNLNDVKKSIARAKANGQAVLLDFHYSDFWVDPSRQWRPAAWNSITDDAVLGDSVFNYTYTVLKTLADEGLLPELVQIGNETNGNIQIKRNNEDIDDGSPGNYPINWSRQVALFHKGIESVQQINIELSSQIKTVIHIAQPENAIWWFNDAVANGLTGFDIIGLSYYPQWSDLNLREVGEHIKILKETYNKDVMVV
jgi:arabinogalactan endo-1,4-beta-galactosidase